MRNMTLPALLFFSLFIISCASTKVDRLKVEQTIDLSGNWNDTDARMVAQEMVEDCLKGNWLTEFMKAEGKNPVVIVGPIRNKTSEHINATVFIKTLEGNLISSGKVNFVASKGERVALRNERADQQQGHTNPATITPDGNETGADFMLQGTINSVVDAVKGKSVMFYQVNLELIDLGTNEVKWVEQTEIKKLVRKSKYSF